MRISRVGLIVIVVIMVPIIVEPRTALVHLGGDISLSETALLGAATIGALLAWAMASEFRGKERSNGE